MGYYSNIETSLETLHFVPGVLTKSAVEAQMRRHERGGLAEFFELLNPEITYYNNDGEASVSTMMFPEQGREGKAYHLRESLGKAVEFFDGLSENQLEGFVTRTGEEEEDVEVFIIRDGEVEVEQPA